MISCRTWFLLGVSSVFLGTTAAFPTSDLSRGLRQRSLVNNSTSESSLLSVGADAEYYFASGDGQYVQQVKSPNDFASAEASFRSLARASNVSATSPNDSLAAPPRPSYKYEYSLFNYNGAWISPPTFGEDLFQCVVNLFKLVPRTSQGVWTPVPGGNYDCFDGLRWGRLEADLVNNAIGYDMSYYDIACVLNMLHSKFADDRSRSFDFVFRAQREEGGEWATVIQGAWKQYEQPPSNLQIGSPPSGDLDVTK